MISGISPTRIRNRLPCWEKRHVRRRLLFVAEAVSLAHVGRPLLLARWARRAGYDVVFACGTAFADLVRAEGFEPLPLPTIPPAVFFQRVRRGRFFYTTDELEDYRQAEHALLHRLQPDLVVSDFRLSLAISTAHTCVPLLSLVNAYWSPSAASRFGPPPAGLLGRLPGWLGRAVFAALRPLAFRRFARPLDEVRRRHGLPALGDFRHHYTAGNGCAYLDLPELVPLSALPPGHFFLGPVLWQPRCSDTLEVEGLEGSRPLIYVSLGGSGDAGVLPAVLEALEQLGADAVVSGIEPERVPIRGSGQRWVVPRLDPGPVLRRAALTVCHGGSGTIYQSLAHGVPLLCLPGNGDQELASSAVAARRAGCLVEPARATASLLARRLAEMLGDGRYRRASRRLARAIRRHDTRRRWLAFLRQALPTIGCHND